MSDAMDDVELSGNRNKGQSLVAAFRAARLSQRPSLRNELRANREALRQERLSRLGRPEPQATQSTLTETLPIEENPAAEKPEQTASPASAASVFASYIGSGEVKAATPEPVADAAASVPLAAAAQAAPAPEAQPAPRIPLSAIGFGPGMMIRLSQLGIETASDLAAADASSLRSALGDISRLINVDLWIASAQDACTKAA
jgi:hypothetical protein